MLICTLSEIIDYEAKAHVARINRPKIEIKAPTIHQPSPQIGNCQEELSIFSRGRPLSKSTSGGAEGFSLLL